MKLEIGGQLSNSGSSAGGICRIQGCGNVVEAPVVVIKVFEAVAHKNFVVV